MRTSPYPQTKIVLLLIFQCGHRACASSLGNPDADDNFIKSARLRPCPDCIKRWTDAEQQRDPWDT